MSPASANSTTAFSFSISASFSGSIAWHIRFRAGDIPTTRDEAASTIFSLIAGFEDEPVEISISGVNSPIPSLSRASRCSAPILA